MVGPFTSVCGCEESLPIQAICATYRACPTGAHGGKGNRSVTHSAESFLGRVPAVRTRSWRHWEVHFCPTAHQLPRRHLDLGERLGGLENSQTRGTWHPAGIGSPEPARNIWRQLKSLESRQGREPTRIVCIPPPVLETHPNTLSSQRGGSGTT